MKKEETAVETMPAIIYIPNNSIKIKVIATIIDKDDEVHEAEMVLRLPEIIEARVEGEYWENENVKYCLTDKARAELEAKHG